MPKCQSQAKMGTNPPRQLENGGHRDRLNLTAAHRFLGLHGQIKLRLHGCSDGAVLDDGAPAHGGDVIDPRGPLSADGNHEH